MSGPLGVTQARRGAVHLALAKAQAARAETVIPKELDLGKVLDVAWFNPTVAQLKASGAVGVIGYLSFDATKNLSGAQVQQYTDAGYGVGTVWETAAGEALGGYALGQARARTAEQQRADIGLPSDHFHRAAVDTDTSWPSVRPYFAGWASVVGQDRIAPYGGIRITEGAYADGYRRCWQTLAWSGGGVDPHAVLYQNGRTAFGGQADINTILAPDWGQYPRAETDMAMTDQDADVLINRMNARRDELAFAVAYWLHRAFDPTIALPTTGTLPPVVGEVASFRASLAAQRATEVAKAQKVLDELTALSTQLGGLESPTAAQVRAGLDEGLRNLGALLAAIPAE